MNFKIKLLVATLFGLQVIYVQNITGSSHLGIDKELGTSIEAFEFIGLDEDNDFEEMNFDNVLKGLLNSARQRLAAELSMEEKSTIIARETASMYQLADSIGLDPAVAVQELKVAFAQEYPEVVAWQYLDERIKNKTRQANKPEWTQDQLQELVKAQTAYAELLQLSKEKAGLSSQDLQDSIKNILVEYPRFHPWIQESLRNNASQFFKNNKNELNQALQAIDQKKQFEQHFHHRLPDTSLEFPLVVNLNKKQRDYYAEMGLLGLTPVENKNVVMDDALLVKQGIDQYLHDELLSGAVASYVVSQKAQYNTILDPLLKTEMLMRSSVSLQNLAETQDQRRALIQIFDAYFRDEIQASKNYLEQNIAAESVMNMLSPDRWNHDSRRKMNSTLYRVYLRCQELKQRKIDNQKKKK